MIAHFLLFLTQHFRVNLGKFSNGPEKYNSYVQVLIVSALESLSEKNLETSLSFCVKGHVIMSSRLRDISLAVCRTREGFY